MRAMYMTIQAAAAAIIAWLSARLGILLPVLCVLLTAMVLDYITGMLASKREALEHPDDPAYGWSSRRGAEGIIKKVGYLCIIAAAMIVDYIILSVAAQAGIEVALKAFFGLLVAVWYILNVTVK
ncbi:MAG TPA: phage holin family protein [Candidatus Eisenbergiella merdigallinarum]|uniref:Phage holin family protein n=1 Tax=Candidatus Eisenbergiella merdigallinarum TaxID=2838552 RepID=A0A9D2MQA3_9FIRM|nr:phage holin family protein [Candidatus Eisenbergiella merdigallinarum]